MLKSHDHKYNYSLSCYTNLLFYFCSDFKEPWWSCSNAWSTTWKQKSYIYKKAGESVLNKFMIKLRAKMKYLFWISITLKYHQILFNFSWAYSSKILVSAMGQLQKYSSIHFFDKGSSISNSVRPAQSDHRSASLKLLDRIHSNVLYILLALPT